MYLVVGHTKFEPDRLFSSISKTFYARDVFCIEMLQDIAMLYSNRSVFTSKQIIHWRSALEEKYAALSGITDLHEFVIGKVTSVQSLKPEKHATMDHTRLLLLGSLILMTVGTVGHCHMNMMPHN